MARPQRVLVVVVGLFSSAVTCRQVADIEQGLQFECTTDQDCTGMTEVCLRRACEQGVCVLNAVTEGEEVTCKTGLLGVCAEGKQKCDGHGQPMEGCVAPAPKAEQCDASELDEDCDGLVNEEGANCVCGDGYVSTGEECDDRGTVGGDKCSATCQEERVLQVVAGDLHTCALLNGGSIKCWGSNFFGQLGLGDVANRGDGPGAMGDSLPTVNLGTGKTATAIATGLHHTCALLNDSSVKCWGRNDYGQLGLGDVANRGDGIGKMGDSLPAVNLGTGKTATAIAVGYVHTCARLNDGSVKCWGYNKLGELGLGDVASRGDGVGEMGDSLPAVNLGTGKTATAIAAGYHRTCALLNNNSVKCWGLNNVGQLGLGDTANRGDGVGEMGDSLPAVNLGMGKTATAIAAGFVHTCARLNDSSVKCWGLNDVGQLGLGDTANRGDGIGKMGDSLPSVDLGTGKTAMAIAAGYAHTCALLNDSSVKCWGLNGFGRLGLGDTANRGSGPGQMGDNLPPVNLSTWKTAATVEGGSGHTCARLKDSSVKCWGLNDHGQLGQGDTADRGDNPDELGDTLATVKLYSDTW